MTEGLNSVNQFIVIVEIMLKLSRPQNFNTFYLFISLGGGYF